MPDSRFIVTDSDYNGLTKLVVLFIFMWSLYKYDQETSRPPGEERNTSPPPAPANNPPPPQDNTPPPQDNTPPPPPAQADETNDSPPPEA